MFLSSWPRPSYSAGLRRRGTRLACEQLEDRTVPSLLTVTNLGNSGAGSLRQAILDANDTTADDTITIEVTGTIKLAGALPDLSTNIDIQGPGANLLTVRRDTGGDYRIFTVPGGTTIALSGLTISNGMVDGNGAGIYNAGTLTVSGCTLSGNATWFGGSGGGLYNSGTATVTASTFNGNYSDWSGSGLYNVGALTLSNSTVSGNAVGDYFGFGAIGAEGPSSRTIITNSTISGNTGQFTGIFTAWSNGYAPLHARNSIIEGVAGDLGSWGHNLIGNTIFGSGFDSTDLLNVNPLLGPLQDNGGPTSTRALLPGSPALDAGDNTDAPPFDQRGLARIVDGNGDGTATIDIGAYEIQTALPGNIPPVAVNDSYSTNEDTALTVPAPGVLGNDNDANGNPLTAVRVSGPAHGTLTLNSNGSFTYTPAANYNGSDSFTYKANDGASDSNLATVSITVIAVNDAPVNSVQGTRTMHKNTSLIFSSGNRNAISIADVDAGSALVQVTLAVNYGTLTLSRTTGLSFSFNDANGIGSGDGTADTTMTFRGTIEDINAALDGLRFTPPKRFSGTVTLTLTTNDLGNNGIGGALRAEDAVTIVVQ